MSAFCGFAPGFAYLSGLPAELAVPRLDTPRTSVPAGSVAVGRPLVRDLPDGLARRLAAARAGPTVDALGPAERQPGPARAGHAGPVGPGMTALLVERAGALTTFQDRGRVGLAHLGVPRAGALDRPAADLANRLLHNQPDAAVLEITLGGFVASARARDLGRRHRCRSQPPAGPVGRAGRAPGGAGAEHWCALLPRRRRRLRRRAGARVPVHRHARLGGAGPGRGRRRAEVRRQRRTGPDGRSETPAAGPAAAPSGTAPGLLRDRCPGGRLRRVVRGEAGVEPGRAAPPGA